MGKSRELNILFISNRSLWPIVDGHTRRSFNILKGLAEKNQIYFLSLYESPDELEEDSINELKKICRKVELHPSPSKKISFPMVIRLLRSLLSIRPYTIWRHYSRPFMDRVHDVIANERFDIIHCDILPMAYTIQKKGNVFCSLTDHDVSYLKCLRMAKDSSNTLFKLFCYLEAYKLKYYEKHIFTRVDIGVVVSEVDRLLLQQNCSGGKFEVIENGVDATGFMPGNDVEPNTLLWLGGFAHYPNTQAVYWFLEKIFPIIKAKNKKVKFQIVGGGVTEKLRHYAAVDNSIEILGYVEDPLSYLQKATVFVAPILSGSGTKLKVIEAMACGKAIVTTSIGSEGIEGLDKKHFLIADSPEVFAENVVKLLENEELTKQIGDSARELIMNKYRWEEIVRKLNSVYSDADK